MFRLNYVYFIQTECQYMQYLYSWKNIISLERMHKTAIKKSNTPYLNTMKSLEQINKRQEITCT